MSAETLRNLFQPFYSTKGDLGDGLGLYILHKIVERHQGTITVDSKIGRGTQIRLRLRTQPVGLFIDLRRLPRRGSLRQGAIP